MFMAIMLFACSKVLHDEPDFENDKLQARISSQLNYDHYWAGIPVSSHLLLRNEFLCGVLLIALQKS